MQIFGLLFFHLITFGVFGGVIQVPLKYDDNPNYSFIYKVNDQITGDSKSQHEFRNGDSVRGSYSLIEPDGSRRIVDYQADSTNGFNAIVYKENAQIQSSTPLTYLQHAAPALEEVQLPGQDQIQDTHYLHNLKQLFMSNIQESAFKDDSQKIILTAPLGRIMNRAMLEKIMENLAPGYVGLAGKIDVPPGYSAKNAY